MGQSRKVPVRWIAVGAFVLLALAAATVGWRASRALRLSKEEVHSEREIRFLVRPLALPGNVNFEAVSAPAVFLQAARFQDHLYIARPARPSEIYFAVNLVPAFLGARRPPSS